MPQILQMQPLSLRPKTHIFLVLLILLYAKELKSQQKNQKILKKILKPSQMRWGKKQDIVLLTSTQVEKLS